MRATRTASAATVFGTVVGGLVLILWALYAWIQLPGRQEPTGPVLLLLLGVGLALWGIRSVSNPRLAIRYYLRRADTVAALIEDWEPRGSAHLEADYEESLHAFLRSTLPFVKVTRQYGAARVKCDIAVGSDVFIELKKGLRSTSKLQRLIGQMELYANEWSGKPIIIVLLGESQEDLLHDLQRSASKYTAVQILTKDVSEPR